MDIWGWFHDEVDSLYSTAPDLARKLESLASHVTSKNHAYLDAVTPELVAATRSMEHAWLEVFVRHWWLQSKLARRFDVDGALSEAVDLLDRAHQPDAEGCPQSICAAQDLCMAYGMIDGPGFVQERIDAAQETLDRIDPSWPCWHCLSSEIGTALIDDDRPQEALDFLEQQDLAANKAGGRRKEYRQTDALLMLNQAEKALAAATERDISGSGEYGEDERDIDRARCLIRLGRYEEAVETLPDWNSIADAAGQFWGYSEALSELIDKEAVKWQGTTILQVAHMVTTLQKHGAWWYVYRVCTTWIRLSVSMEVPCWFLAHILVGRAREAQSHFRDPQRAESELAELQKLTDACRPEPWTGSPNDIQAQFDLGLEQRQKTLISKTISTVLDRPDVTELVLFVAGYWRQFGFVTESIETYHKARRDQPANADLMIGLAGALLEDKDWSELESLLDRLPANAEPELAAPALWYRSQLVELQSGDFEAAAEYLETFMSTYPDHVSEIVVANLARLRELLNEHEQALQLWTRLVETAEDPTHWHWQRITAATRLQQWSVVRESTAELGMTVEPGDEPIDDNWGPICLLDIKGEAQPKPIWAQRTGPVTARVISLTGPNRAERFGETLIFNPEPLDAPDPSGADEGDSEPTDSQTDEAAEEKPLIFPIAETLEPGHHENFPWDGPRPEPEVLDTFLNDLQELGCQVLVASPEEYMQTDPESDATTPAIWILVAIPKEPDLKTELKGRFEQLAKDVDTGTAAWPELLNALGEQELAAEHVQRQIDWGMQ